MSGAILDLGGSVKVLGVSRETFFGLGPILRQAQDEWGGSPYKNIRLARTGRFCRPHLAMTKRSDRTYEVYQHAPLILSLSKNVDYANYLHDIL